MPLKSLIQVVEDVRDNAASTIVAIVNRTLDLYGPQPYGYGSSDRLANVEFYLEHRDDAAYWQECAQQWTAMYGAEAADAMLLGTTTYFEQQIESMGGLVAVRHAILEARISRVRPQVMAAEKQLERPSITLLEPLPPYDEVAAFSEIGGAV